MIYYIHERGGSTYCFGRLLGTRKLLFLLGLKPTSYSEVLDQLRKKALERAKLTEDDILHTHKKKKNRRKEWQEKNKEYEKSDAIRKNLALVGITLMDTLAGTSWRPAFPLAMQEREASCCLKCLFSLSQ